MVPVLEGRSNTIPVLVKLHRRHIQTHLRLIHLQRILHGKVRQIIRDYLNTNPGSTKDCIYDEVVSRLIRAGRMKVHNFEELLTQTAEEIIEPIKKVLFEAESPNLFGTHEAGRWYLRESQVDVVDAGESTPQRYQYPVSQNEHPSSFNLSIP